MLGASAIFEASAFSSLPMYFVARARSSSIVDGGLPYKVFKNRPGFSPTVMACMATVGCKFGMLRQALVKRDMNCLSGSFLP